MREREVADVVFADGETTAAQIEKRLPYLTNSSIRMMLKRLESKGVVRRRKDGRAFRYSPALREGMLKETALKRIADQHFDGSLHHAALKIIEMMEIQQPGSAARIASRYRLSSAS